MKRLIPQFGDACLQSRGDAFTTLARSIVGQQISVKAAQSVWDRFAALPRRDDAAPTCCKLKVDDMRAAGLSARKIEYLVDLALHFDRRRDPRRPWREMADEEIIAELVGIRGIGRWTAEMFLIFHLMRPERAAAGRRRPASRASARTTSRATRCQSQRRARSGRRVGALLLGGHLVYLALARPGAGGVLTGSATRSRPWRKGHSSTSSSRSRSSRPRSRNCATCRTSRRSTSPKRSTASARRASS